jgi:hypothetical protein
MIVGHEAGEASGGNPFSVVKFDSIFGGRFDFGLI